MKKFAMLALVLVGVCVLGGCCDKCQPAPTPCGGCSTCATCDK